MAKRPARKRVPKKAAAGKQTAAAKTTSAAKKTAAVKKTAAAKRGGGKKADASRGVVKKTVVGGAQVANSGEVAAGRRDGAAGSPLPLQQLEVGRKDVGRSAAARKARSRRGIQAKPEGER